MGTPYISEIRPFAFGFAPKGWLACQGQLLSITQNQALFALLGTLYGGNGQTTFGLPDLRGRVAIGMGNAPGGNSYNEGAAGGEENHTLVLGELAQHGHLVDVSNSTKGSQSTPSTSTVLGVTSGPGSSALTIYGTGSQQGVLASQTVGNAGANQAHPNIMPYGVLSYCIAINGIFPSRN